jgi:hypothetical protein
MGLASIRRLGPLWRKLPTSSLAAKIAPPVRCVSVPSLAAKDSTQRSRRCSVRSVLRLERHGEHRESWSGCGFAALSNNSNIQVFYRGKREGTVGRSKKAGVECYPPIPVNARPLIRPVTVLTFSHPDCTVGPGVSPDPGACRPSTLCPLIAPANWSILLLAGSLSQTPMRELERFGPPLAGFTADWELERRAFKSFPHPAPKVGHLRNKS